MRFGANRATGLCSAFLGLALLVSAAACGSDDDKQKDSPSAGPSSAVEVDNDSGKITLPDGMSAGVVVYDREQDKITIQSGQDDLYMATSMVKLLFAIDYLRTNPPSSLDDSTKGMVTAMLSSNEDDFATKIYKSGGKDQYLQRLVNELKLNKTSAPPEGHSGWGAWQTSASDIVLVYKYILGDFASSNAEASKFILEALGGSAKCAADGFNQAFGIPTLGDGNKKSLQGWYQFPNTAAVDGCDGNVAVEYEVDEGLEKEYMHSTGLVGENDRSIVVVLTSHPKGTAYATATANVNALVSMLKLTA